LLREIWKHTLTEGEAISGAAPSGGDILTMTIAEYGYFDVVTNVDGSIRHSQFEEFN
jgi:hypothetical protein